MYRDDRTTHGLPAATPWDIGGPQPVVKQLVSLGAVKGEVLDPGTGPGHHAFTTHRRAFRAPVSTLHLRQLREHGPTPTEPACR